MQEIGQGGTHLALVRIDVRLDHIDDLIGIRREHRARDDVQGRMHHGGRDIGFARLRECIPFRQQPLRHLGHDRRVAGNAARIERWRHDAAMAPPRLALAG